MLGHGFTRYWDAAASAPYLYSAEQKIFVTYDDPESLAAKCTYVMTHGLGGVMFWQYSDDPSGALLQTIARTLHQSTPSSR
jgi:chitinase